MTPHSASVLDLMETNWPRNYYLAKLAIKLLDREITRFYDCITGCLLGPFGARLPYDFLGGSYNQSPALHILEPRHIAKLSRALNGKWHWEHEPQIKIHEMLTNFALYPGTRSVFRGARPGSY